MMKTLSIAVLMLGWGGMVSQAGEAEFSPGDDGNVPPEVLAQMGLRQMEVLSDEQGEEIRGSGFFFHGRHGFFHHHKWAWAKIFYFLHKRGKGRHGKGHFGKGHFRKGFHGKGHYAKGRHGKKGGFHQAAHFFHKGFAGKHGAHFGFHKHAHGHGHHW